MHLTPSPKSSQGCLDHAQQVGSGNLLISRCDLHRRLARGAVLWTKLCILIVVALPEAGRSTAIEWNNTGTSWTASGNWVGGSVPSDSTVNDIATFGSTGTSATSPTLTAGRSINGINFLSGAYAYTMANTSILRIGSSGITDSSTNLQTFNGPLSMSITQSWTIGAGGSMLFNNTVDLNNNAATSRTLTLAGSGDATFGVIQNSFVGSTGGVTVTTTGTIIIAGASTYNGTTTISAGTLQLGSGGAAGSIDNSTSVVNNGTLAFNRTDNALTIGVAISGSGAVNQIGSGTTILSATNSYTGQTTISSGTLQLGTGAGGSSAGNISSSSSVVNNGVLTFNRTGSPLFSTVISGSGAVNLIGTGTIILSETNTYTGLTTISAGTLQLGNGAGGGTTGNISNSSGVVNNSVLTFNRSNSPVFSAPISGSGAVNVIGTGTVILSATNSYTGVTTISAGTLQLGSGTGGGSVGNISSSSSVVNNSVLTFNRSNSPVFAAPISGSGAVNVIGTGTIILTNANSYTGLTTISAGALQLGNGGTTGSISASSVITNNGTLIFSRSNALVQGTDFAAGISGTGGVTQSGSGTTTLSGTNTYSGITTAGGGILRLDSANALPGGASGAGAGTSYLMFNNGGIIGLTPSSGDFTRAIDNSTSPATVFTSNLVRWGSSGGESGGFAAFDGDRTVNFGNNGAQVTWSSGNGVFGSGLILSDSSSNSTVIVTNPIALSNSNSSRTITVNDGSAAVDAIMAGVLSSTTTRLIKSGAGTLALTATNTYGSALGAGVVGTTISAGTLQVGNGSTIGSIAAGSDINNNATLAFNRSDALTVSNLITGTGLVKQIGSGTTTLSGANTYTGGTALNAGSLIVTNTTGSATGAGGVTTASGTILGGTGKISPTGSSSVSIGGTLSPGVAGTNNGVGALTLTPVNGNVTLASTSNVIFQLGSNGTNGLVLTYNPDGTINAISGTPSLTGNDRLLFNASGTGILDLTAAASGSLDVVFANGYTPQALDAFDLIDWNNVAISGLNVGLLDLPSLGNPSLVWDTSKFVSNGIIAVAQVVAAPEPARASMLVGGLAWLCLKRHRRGETMV